MRNFVLACAAGAALLTAIAVPRADAMPVVPIAASPLADNVAYFCRPVWRCGPYDCGWRQACGWRPGPYYGRYGFLRPWGRPWAYHWGYRRYW